MTGWGPTAGQGELGAALLSVPWSDHMQRCWGWVCRSSRWVRKLSEQEQLAQNFVEPLLASAKALLILAARSQGPQTASDSHPAPTLF